MHTSCDTLIFAAHLITQNTQRELHADAAIAIKDGKIVALGKAQNFTHFQAKQTLDLRHCLIMPGLVNAHTHVAMTFLRGLADDMPLMDWLQKIIFPVEQHLSPEIVELGTLLGCAEMIATGTTAFQDMYLMENAVGKAVDTVGLKARIGEVLFSFPSPAYANTDAAFSLLEKQLAQWQQHPRIRLSIMPHSVYTTSSDLLTRALAFSEKHNLPIHLHLGETIEETMGCLQKYGLRPLAFCESLGLLSPRTSIAHGVDILLHEMYTLSHHGISVVHNQKSNMKLASGMAPVSDMQQSGINVALGTDGAASNNQLNMFSEMNVCALLHKIREENPGAMPAQTVLDMATLNGAKALCWDGLGCLDIGHAADLIALDLRSPNMQPLYNPVSHVVYAASGHEVRLTMVDGQILYQDGQFKTLDYPLLLKEIQKLMQWVKEKLPA